MVPKKQATDKIETLEKATVESTSESKIGYIRAKGEQKRKNIHVQIRSVLAVIIILTIILSFFTEKINIPGYFVGFVEAILAFYFFKND